MRRFTVAILVFSFCGTISTSPIFREVRIKKTVYDNTI